MTLILRCQRVELMVMMLIFGQTGRCVFIQTLLAFLHVSFIRELRVLDRDFSTTTAAANDTLLCRRHISNNYVRLRELSVLSASELQTVANYPIHNCSSYALPQLSNSSKQTFVSSKRLLNKHYPVFIWKCNSCHVRLYIYKLILIKIVVDVWTCAVSV